MYLFFIFKKYTLKKNIYVYQQACTCEKKIGLKSKKKTVLFTALVVKESKSLVWKK